MFKGILPIISQNTPIQGKNDPSAKILGVKLRLFGNFKSQMIISRVKMEFLIPHVESAFCQFYNSRL
jgi:hypothetical protein